jgi:hypothetical protein
MRSAKRSIATSSLPCLPLILRSGARPSRPSDSEAVANGAQERRVSKDEGRGRASWFETRFALLTMRV